MSSWIEIEFVDRNWIRRVKNEKWSEINVTETARRRGGQEWRIKDGFSGSEVWGGGG